MDYFLIAGFLFLAIAAWQYFTHYERAKGDVNQQMGDTQGKNATDMGILSAKYQSKRTIENTNYTNALTDQTTAVFELDVVPDRKRRVEEIEKATHFNTKKVIEDSTNDGLLLTNQQAIKVAKATARIETDKAKELGRHKVDMELLSQLNVILAICRYRHLRFDELDEVRGRIMTLIDDEAKIENSNLSAQAKGQKLELIERSKRIYKEVLDDFENRVLEAGDTEEIPGIETFDTFDGGFGSGAGAKVEEPIPIKAFGNRGTQANNH